MSNPKISIIIPIYNVEKYLRKCLNSVLTKQNLTDIEVICVNDESPDNCAKILEEYEKKDSRVKVLNQKNGGQGVARNTALKIATGEYVLFLDPDDWMEENSLEKLYNKIKSDDSDVVFFNVIKHFEERENDDDYKTSLFKFADPYYLKFEENVFHPLDAIECLYQTNACPYKIYKMESLKKYNYHYTPHRHWEDHLPYFCFLANCERISVLNEFLYNYTVRKQSSTFTATKRCLEDSFDSFYEIEKELKNTKYGNELLEQFIVHKINNFFYYMNLKFSKNKNIFYKEIKKVINYIKETYGEDFFKRNLLEFQTEFLLKYNNYYSYVIAKKINRTKIFMKILYDRSSDKCLAAV